LVNPICSNHHMDGKIQIPKELLQSIEVDQDDDRREIKDDKNNEKLNEEPIFKEEKLYNHKSPLIDDSKKKWNYNILLLLKKIGEKSMGYRWMHDRDALNNDEQRTTFLKIEIVLGTLLSVVTGGELIGFLASEGFSNNKILQIVLMILQLLLIAGYGVIRGYEDSSDFDKSKYDHTFAASKFGAINLNIQNQLALNIEDRDHDRDFLKNIIKEFDDLMLTSPQIDRSTMNAYIKATENYSIYKPTIVGGIDTIEIVIDNGSNNKLSNVVSSEKEKIHEDQESKLKYELNRWLQHF
jgi:hypothetical protein